MFVKWILVLWFLGCLDALSPHVTSQPCTYPRIDNGRIRMRQKTKLVRFSCYPRYELVGNKYAICRSGKWDVPLPVCVKPGCAFEEIDNGIIIPSRGGAWLMYFCLPGHKRIGSPARYCDGRKWNASSPVCVDSSTPSQLSCDFEDTNLCGWTQDALHDFDWQRLNKGTPSSVLFTGPSHDHTSGKGGLGYYMYIESTGRIRNDTARLLSPVYDKQLSKDGCFSFYYHMYGETTGGLKIYQKPDNVTLGQEKQNYVIFEKWGNQGDMWLNAVVALRDYEDDFQIIIEGIRGASFTSDIAIDDVSIQQGENCSAVNVATTTTREMPESCAGRCHSVSLGQLGCSCIIQCLGNGTCCPDFLDFCVFSQDQNNTPDDISTTPEELLHQNTQKLVVSSSSEAPSTTPTSTEITTVKTTIPPTKPKTTLTSTTPKPKPTIKITSTPVPTKKTTILLVTTKKVTNPTIVFKTTPLIYNATGKLKKDVNKTVNTKPLATVTVRTTKVSTPKVTTAKITTKIVKQTTTSVPRGISRTIENHDVYHDMVEKAKKEQRIEAEDSPTQETIVGVAVDITRGSSNSIRTGIIVTSSLVLICACAVYFVMVLRSARGKNLVARLRGQVCRDQEVRYLTTNVDDDDE